MFIYRQYSKLINNKLGQFSIIINKRIEKRPVYKFKKNKKYGIIFTKIHLAQNIQRLSKINKKLIEEEKIEENTILKTIIGYI